MLSVAFGLPCDYGNDILNVIWVLEQAACHLTVLLLPIVWKQRGL